LIACFGAILFFFTLLCINAVPMPLYGVYALARADCAIEVKRQINGLFNGKSFNHIKVKCILLLKEAGRLLAHE
jgi:hypothetical protein